MTTADVISDAIRSELTGRDHELPDHVIEAIAQNIAIALRETQLLSTDQRDALERISDAYPGDHDYPGIIARRALEATT